VPCSRAGCSAAADCVDKKCDGCSTIALLDFAHLDKAVRARTAEEFARSRLKLQSRYHHVLIDEFRTARVQWRLIERWSTRGARGGCDRRNGIDLRGRRPQTVHLSLSPREVRCSTKPPGRLQRCAQAGQVRQAITTSFRAVPGFWPSSTRWPRRSKSAVDPERFTR
jgi:hypothetical protein